MSKFSVGQKVRIAKGSEFYKGSSNNNPKDMDGEICKMTTGLFGHYVLWENGEKNQYREEDLILHCEQPKTPHVHAEIIKVWADGEEIQFRRPYGDGKYSKWMSASTPTFDTYLEYRVKPVEVPFEVKHAVQITVLEKVFQRKVAISLLKRVSEFIPVSTHAKDLSGMFIWSNTPQGKDFWISINLLINKED